MNRIAPDLLSRDPSRQGGGKRVMVISLYPLSQTGGGERFTLDTIRSIIACGDSCDAYALKASPPRHRNQIGERLQMPLSLVAHHSRMFSKWPTERFRDVLDNIYRFDIIVVHQYFSNDLIFDLVATVSTDQTLILTGHGHEAIRAEFISCYQQSPNHYFVEVSCFSAERCRQLSRLVTSVGAGVWASDIKPIADRDYSLTHEVAAVGRILPHKGFEHSINGLPAECHLNIVGPSSENSPYQQFLRAVANGKRVTFHGEVSDAAKWGTIAESDVLVASSCCRLWDGQVIEQAELLGIVLMEALAVGTLPITSDIPPFKEVMTNLGLQEFLYSAGDSGSLRNRIDYFRQLDSDQRKRIVEEGRAKLAAMYLWDDYWTRVKAVCETVY